MQMLVLLVYIGLFIIFLILGFASIKYFITMWKFKNRKKDGSEDDEFRKFDWINTIRYLEVLLII